MIRTGSGRVFVGVSVTPERADAMRSNGPRRDFDVIRDETDGILCYASRQHRRGYLGRLLGPHLELAWRMARQATSTRDAIFADGEHVGLPLLLFLAVHLRRPARVVMLGHLPGRWWKRLAFAAFTRLWTPGVVLVHSVEQRRILESWLGKNWRIEAIPYQVDTTYWTPTELPRSDRSERDRWPTVLAVGAEHRDYLTLLRASQGLPCRVVIAGGSHWARNTTDVGELPDNVEYLEQTLGFDELRDRYRQAFAVVVPLEDIPNQSGVTTILEAMSVARPVVVTASRGQRECVAGPLIHPDGTIDFAATADRGPSLVTESVTSSERPTGLYVSPTDPIALRSALHALLDDPALCETLATNARASTERDFTVEAFAIRVARHLDPLGSTLTAANTRTA